MSSQAQRIILMRPTTDVEGSRGGKIIGRTSSGKPIYASASHGTHKGFSSKEHHEAPKSTLT